MIPQVGRVVSALVRLKVRVSVLISAGVCITSCILPVQPVDQRFMDEASLAVIEPGIERSSVAEILGQPDLRPVRDGRWIYRTRTSAPGGVEICTQSANLGCERLGAYRTEFLDVSFSDDGVVAQVESSAVEDAGCTDSGVCVAGTCFTELVLYSSQRLPESAAMPPNPAECVVVAYAQADAMACYVIRFGPRQPAKLLTDTEFIRERLRPGTYELSAIGEYVLMDRSRYGLTDSQMASRWTPHTLECEAGNTYFLELRYVEGGMPGTLSQEIRVVDSEPGLRAIRARREILAKKVSPSALALVGVELTATGP